MHTERRVSLTSFLIELKYAMLIENKINKMYKSTIWDKEIKMVADVL
jgi:hypothetical protein